MTVKELISQLEKFDEGAPVSVYWDMGLRSDVDEVFLIEKDEVDVGDERLVALVDSHEMEAFRRNYPKAAGESNTT